MIFNDKNEVIRISEIAYPQLEIAMAFLEQAKMKELDNGRHDISGNLIYANVESYETRSREHTRYEAHRKYIDIQYMISGIERIDVASVTELEVDEAYNDSRDITFFKDCPETEKLVLSTGDFVVFFPEDAHRPCIAMQKEKDVKKMVIKIAI